MHRSLIVLSLALITASPAISGTCGFTELTMTSSGFSFRPVSNHDGSRIAFMSSADPLGINADGNFEILLLDTPSGTITPITNTPESSSGPSIDATGTVIAYQSRADITGGNADGSFEIFISNTQSLITTQITATAGDSVLATLSADANTLVFRSTADLTGGNADGSQEIFLMHLDSQLINQLSSDPVLGSTFPTLSREGTTVAFASRANLTGGNPDEDFVIYAYDVTTGILRQVTDAFADVGGTTLSLSDDGRYLTFYSSKDITGGNPDNFFQIFLVDLSTDTLSQVTHFAADSVFPTMSPSGDTIAFNSEINTGTNPEDNFEIFELTHASSYLLQLTSTVQAVTQPPSYSGDGQTLFSAWDAAVPGNPDLNIELFSISRCGLLGDGFESGDTSAWSSAVP